ncbi:MAG: flavodoxin-dependent (E)-4-hydroxy-3-methylbut-2-enyl-diphosphate synthase [Planctomycetota bacterium]|nr:flavodoxin-dependent (E)-4-hydroxy-3-methylbut-2-enyl-diphosphate synthase [Planctomycetota bacterium]
MAETFGSPSRRRDDAGGPAAGDPERRGKLPPRRKSIEVRVGNIVLGGEHPIRVQTMTTSRTSDREAVLAEARRLEDAGAELIRVTVRDAESLANVPALKAALRVPLVADIHFDYRMAIGSIEAGADKVRINPGNIGGGERLREVVRAAAGRGVAIRIGINSGSLERDILDRYGYPCPEALRDSALRWIERCESWGYRSIVVSVKSSDVPAMVESYRLLAAACDYPLHLGVTEAGPPPYGTIKSAVGIGALLLEGIGDTIRVSLTADSALEVQAGFDILQATGRRLTRPELIACPTCGRKEIDVEKMVAEVKAELDRRGIRKPVKISILGCVVNGPGEAREADVGIAVGRGKGVVFRRGEAVRSVETPAIMSALMEEIERFLAGENGDCLPGPGRGCSL